MVTLAIRYGTRFSSSHSHTFWQYGHHAWLSLYKVTRTDASGCPKVRTSACECVGPVAWSGGTYDAANGASSDQLSAARLARVAAFESSIFLAEPFLGNVAGADMGFDEPQETTKAGGPPSQFVTWVFELWGTGSFRFCDEQGQGDLPSEAALEQH